MEFWIYVLIHIFILGVIVYLTVIVSEPDSKWNKKIFDGRVGNIEYACERLKIKEVNVANKGCLFRVRVVNGEGVKRISYSSPYKVTDIYINDELVCKIHRLENLFTTHRTLEYVTERKRTEIDEIIMKAYKTSKKQLNEYYKTSDYQLDSKSFYKN